MGLKRKIREFKYKIRDFFNGNAINVSWDKGTNFGDALNPILLNKITNKKILWVNRNYYNRSYLMCIGSILQKANSNTLVWGSGFISEDSILNEKPKKICAVRGPKTRNKLISLGIDCPEVYGDPALLMPKFYNPKIKKKYKLGIIPHYVDQDNEKLDKFKENNEIIIIDIKMKNHLKFIDLVLSCDKVVSSSLHGVIIADAYNIPSIWIEFSNKVKGNGFKFFDYFESVNRLDKKAYYFSDKTNYEDLMKLFYTYKININLDQLLDVFPFYNERR